MTIFEQYVEVANYIKSSSTNVPVLIAGEPIEISPPYVVLKAFGITNEHCSNARKDVKGYNLFCYGENRGRTEKLLSDMLDLYSGGVTSSRLEISDLANNGSIERLEDNLYEAVLSFNVSSIFNK